MSYEQRMIVLFIIGANGVAPKDRVNAANLILTVYDESQIDRIKREMDKCCSHASRAALINKILQMGQSLKEGAD